ncbi:hypothetical protein EJ03DRAFT_347203 [Teratosphaeria nubilosa]|uniref:Uncharacterized protein n=1 Tax=Teratosphaeria nubilosa TaxID=161662 RepID=A0A6G1LNQ7_9PEZI|nr:hypothetical protein EJ03DRAFT_347203 [Teratosphaeria nubilosa]
MTGLETRTQPKPLAHIIAEYDDDKLDEYLQANARVQDPENIQPSFIQRLRDKVHASREAADPRPVDFAQLAARLHDVSAGVAPPARALSPSPTHSLPSNEEQDAEDLKEEIGLYSALLEAGGRPPYPRHLLNDFFWEPE